MVQSDLCRDLHFDSHTRSSLVLLEIWTIVKCPVVLILDISVALYPVTEICKERYYSLECNRDPVSSNQP